MTETANVGWAWSSTGPKDSLAITAPSDMTYVQADGEVDVVSFVATPTLLMGTGGPVNGSLTASVDVPEPLTIAVLGTGLFGIGLVRRRQPTVR